MDGIEMRWKDAGKKLVMRLADGSRMLARRAMVVKLAEMERNVTFAGKTVEVSF